MAAKTLPGGTFTMAEDLTVTRMGYGAMQLAGPGVWGPPEDRDEAIARRDEVLRALRRSGDISAAQYTAAAGDRTLHLRPSPAYASREPYFVGYVENLLEQEYGAATIRTGGLRIYTTIRPRLQRAAVRALSQVLYARRDPAGAIVSIDPASGAIRAMAGALRDADLLPPSDPTPPPRAPRPPGHPTASPPD